MGKPRSSGSAKEEKERSPRRVLPHMVWLTPAELSTVLNCLDFVMGDRKTLTFDLATIADLREKIALAKFGKIRKADMPAIRQGKRIPAHHRQHSKTSRAQNSTEAPQPDQTIKK